MFRRLFLLLVGLACASAVGTADDWSQWRGSKREGISPEKGLLDQWDDAPPLVWKAEGLGKGEAAAVIQGGIVCTMGDHKFKMNVIALSDKDGREIWRTEIGNVGGPKNYGSMCTPTMDGERVYAISADGNLVCLKTASGERIWEKSFKRDYGGDTQQFGYAESPLIDDDKLICSPGGPEAGVVALDKRTGVELWRCAVSFENRNPSKDMQGASYSSVVISQGAGIKQYVQLMGQGLVGIDAETGKQLWSYNRLSAVNSPSTSIILDDYVLAPCGWYNGSALLKLARTEDGGVEAKEIYLLKPQELATQSGGAVRVGDYVYGSHAQTGRPQCFEFLTGKLMWEKGRGPGSGAAAVIYADGHVYFKYRDGTMILVAANPHEYRLKGEFQTPEPGNCLAHLAISHGRLYLRSDDVLYCYDLKKK